MRMASMPVAVIMQRRAVDHPWADEAWAAVGIVPDHGGLPKVQQLENIAVDGDDSRRQHFLVSGLTLELYPDENDGYFENCVAPEPKVFVMWRMQEGIAMPMQVSVSYAEGTRMLDSGEQADGVAMPAAIRSWLACYLQMYYQPPQQGRRGRQHG
jgi:hypothetical protein